MDEKVDAISATNALEMDSEKHVDNGASVEEYPHPTDEELRTLRKVAETLPLVSFSLCLVEFAERASYYGAKTVFSNFIQFPLPKGMAAESSSSFALDTFQVEMEPEPLREARRRRRVPWAWDCRPVPVWCCCSAS